MGFLKKTNALRISTASPTAIGIWKEINLWEILIQNASSGWVKPLIIGTEKRKWQMNFYILLPPRMAEFLTAWISFSIGEFFILNWLHRAKNFLGADSHSAGQRSPITFLRNAKVHYCVHRSLWTPPSTRQIQSTNVHPIPIRYISIFSSHLFNSYVS
jgi:hypothetical protein